MPGLGIGWLAGGGPRWAPASEESDLVVFGFIDKTVVRTGFRHLPKRSKRVSGIESRRDRNPGFGVLKCKKTAPKAWPRAVVEACADCDICRYLMEDTPCRVFPEIYRLYDKEAEKGGKITPRN